MNVFPVTSKEQLTVTSSSSSRLRVSRQPALRVSFEPKPHGKDGNGDQSPGRAEALNRADGVSAVRITTQLASEFRWRWKILWERTEGDGILGFVPEVR